MMNRAGDETIAGFDFVDVLFLVVLVVVYL